MEKKSLSILDGFGSLESAIKDLEVAPKALAYLNKVNKEIGEMGFINDDRKVIVRECQNMIEICRNYLNAPQSVQPSDYGKAMILLFKNLKILEQVK